MFCNLWLREGRKTRTIITYRSKDFPANHLPANLAPLQSYDNEGALIRFVGGILTGASSFRQDGEKTTYLYNGGGNETTLLTVPATPSDPAPASRGIRLQIGSIVDGKYQILTKIGQGGFSTVYLAVNKSANKHWAIKELLKEKSKNFDIVLDSFRSEISIIQSLDHPGIPRIAEVIENQDAFILVMDYVEGESLQRRLTKRGPLDEELILNVAKQLCDVLGYLHNRPTPIIYRDMKPANVMLCPDGRIKIIDFGTARTYKINAVEDTTCLGTRGYAAPEQYGGMGQTDARTDIYSLGVTLYHLVTGKNPAEPPYEILPIREVDPSLSPGLEYIIKKCTQKDPAERYQSALELLQDLENVDKLGKKSFFKPRAQKKATQSKKNPTVPFAPPQKKGNGVTPIAPPFGIPSAKPIKNGGFAVPGQAPVGKPANGFAVPGQGPVVPPKSGGFVPTPPPKPAANVDPRLAEAMAKLISLDPTSKEIVLQLIDKLSQS
ncbi:MAG: protein kinase [Clostridia bacterium]|nr:protein kinase [Clostridia bacterium]